MVGMPQIEISPDPARLWTMLLLVSIVTILGACWVVRRIARYRRNWRELNLAQQGSMGIEMMISLPIFIGLIFLAVQITMLLMAMQIVQYAAYCAARTAIVVIPETDQPEQGREYDTRWSEQGGGGSLPDNTTDDSTTHPNQLNPAKYEYIRHTAALACIPAAPRELLATESFHSAIVPSFSMLGSLIPGSTFFEKKADTYMVKFTNALLLTHVTVEPVAQLQAPDYQSQQKSSDPYPKGYQYGNNEGVMVEVSFGFVLQIPLVKSIFADSSLDIIESGHATGWILFGNLAGKDLAMIRARCILHNEGGHLGPNMPPEPL